MCRNWFVAAAVIVLYGLLSALGPGARAQQTPDTLVAGMVNGMDNHLSRVDTDGTRSGFVYDLSTEIAAEIGAKVTFRDYSDVKELIAGLQNGEIDLIAGIVAFPALQPGGVLSTPVARSGFAYATRVENFDQISNGPTPDMRVAVPQVHYERVSQALRDQVQLIPVANGPLALTSVLFGSADAAIMPETVAFSYAKTAGVAHRLQLAPSSMPATTRHVVLSQARADLLPQVNAAIERLRADGRLGHMLRRNFVEIPPPPPEVLTVGVRHFPPFQIVGEDGSFSGFGVDTFRDIAELAGLNIVFREISVDEWLEGPHAGSYDIHTQIGIEERRREVMDFTLAIERVALSIFVRKGDEEGISGLEDLAGMKVASTNASIAAKTLHKYKAIEPLLVESAPELFDRLLSGDVDAVFFSRDGSLEVIKQRGLGTQIVEITPPSVIAERAPALRFGLDSVREALNAVIPGYLISDRYQTLWNKYFAEPPFWTATRIRIAIATAVGLALLSAALGLAYIQSLRARERLSVAEETARRTSEAAIEIADQLRLSEQRLRRAQLIAKIGDWEVDEAGRSVWSEQMRNLSGLPTPEWPEGYDSYLAHVHPDDREHVNRVRQVALERKTTGEVSHRYIRPDGEERIFNSIVEFQWGAEDQLLRTTGTVQDITSQAEIEAKLRQSQKMEAIGNLTGGVAHDFNNLLAVILGNLELIGDSTSPDDIRRYSEAAIEATTRGAGLTKNLLSFARQSRLEPVLLNLNELADANEAWWISVLPEDIEVNVALAQDLWPILADVDLTHNAVLNLVLNARDAMPNGGKLTIETQNILFDADQQDLDGQIIPKGQYVLLAISDTGCGISKEDKARIFEPFFSTKPVGRGSGMGLSMVQGFMDQSGGMVKVYSELGAGTSIKLYFPAIKSPGDATDPGPDAVPIETQGGARILLVEDDANVLSVLTEILSQAGYQLQSARSGDVAFALMQRDNAFDLLVTDIKMPGQLQGTQLARQVRKTNPDMPVIFMSGYASEATVHGNGLRPEDIRLMKPVPRTALLNAVAEALARRKRGTT
ncbi:transporter substrate-binding domain-containing protein [Aliishimia ponticola]|uniref:histidine kinase n=1 Tax=Aliishimia ponticola TaxID=2499833 RepID=A0A4S4NJP8_9RHOB|nr:transporter substrate-binding domain-containing protein [Aliishimia ponticola]THH39125.1 transporter substrate-binding domain-containing protein [Aliishimia ponticola]